MISYLFLKSWKVKIFIISISIFLFKVAILWVAWTVFGHLVQDNEIPILIFTGLSIFSIFSKLSGATFCPGPATLYSPNMKEFNSCPLGKLEYFNPEKFPSLSKTAIVGVLSTFTLASNSLFSPSLYEENFNFSGAIEAISFTASSIAKDSSIAGFLKTTISTGFSNLSTTVTNCCFKSSS